MLTEVKNQTKVIFLSVRYNIMREMTNRVTFLTNISFMILNNATFIIQWLLLFHLKKRIGGYNFSDIMLLWGFAASTYGLSHIFFQRAYELSSIITNGKLDSFLVQPKNVLLGVITSGTNASALGDLIYGYLVVLIFNFSFFNLFLFTLLSILGSLTMTAFAIIAGSISFFITRGDMIADNLYNTMICFSTYPDSIFKGVTRFLLYTLVPVGFIIYLPMQIVLHFSLPFVLAVSGFTTFIMLLAFFIFYRGLKRYTSSSLMIARI